MGSSTTGNPERVAWNATVRAYERTGMAWDWPTLNHCHPVLAAIMERLGMIYSDSDGAVRYEQAR